MAKFTKLNIGDIVASSGGRVWKKLSVESEESLITFTIAGTSYQAKEGMTWAEWIVSEYNTDKLVNDNGIIRDSSGDTDMQVAAQNIPGFSVSATERIISNGKYYWVAASHGGGSND